MCGRFALNRAITQLRALLSGRRVVENEHRFIPSNNITPTTPVPVVLADEIRVMIWGIQSVKRIINARSETVMEKFGSNVRQRRCLVPVDGYFEWNAEQQPFFFTGGEPLFLASFYTNTGEFVILTRAASSQVSRVHKRMPIILTMSQIDQWMGDSWVSVIGLVPPSVVFFRVSRIALKAGNNSESCVKPLKEKMARQRRIDSLLKIMES